jgi:hypothetical protein
MVDIASSPSSCVIVQLRRIVAPALLVVKPTTSARPSPVGVGDRVRPREPDLNDVVPDSSMCHSVPSVVGRELAAVERASSDTIAMSGIVSASMSVAASGAAVRRRSRPGS